MKILALEFSSARRSVAWSDLSAPADNPPVVITEELRGREATSPLVLIDACLRQSESSAADVEGIIVSLGPGSYTGIRTAIALVQGWHLARPLSCAGFSTMEVLARQLSMDGFEGEVQLLIPASRGQCYLQPFAITTHCVQSLHDLQLVSSADLDNLARNGRPIYGPSLSEVCPGATEVFPTARALWECARFQDHFKDQPIWAPVNLQEDSFLKAPPSRRW